MNVLLLSDFSQVAINATHYAMDLLQDEKVNFTLLNIYEPDPDCTEEGAEAKRKTTQAALEERVEKLQARSQGRAHKIAGFYSEDTLVDAARDFVAENQVDLLVMGAVGTAFRHVTILGNHTFEIMSKIKCNILAVTEDSSYQKIEKILMPVDFSASFGKRNIRFLDDSPFFHNANLRICELVKDGKLPNPDVSTKGEAFKNLENLEVEFSSLEEAAMFDREVLNEVQKKFNLIVLLGKNLKICDRLLHNKHGIYTSVPNRLPILVLHD